MSIPIIMPTYNRPHYFEQAIDALFRCENLDKFYIETFEENESYFQYMNSHILEKYTDQGIEIIRNKHSLRKGCAPNILEAMQEITNKHEFFVIVEDDILLSRDALNLALWAFPQLTDERPAIIFHCKKHQSNDYPGNEHKIVMNSKFFHPWGWAGKSSFFRDKFLKSYDWNIDKSKGWDMPINVYALKYNINFLQSYVGRSQNIGVIGNCQRNPEEHRKYCFNEFYYQAKPVREFKLKPGNLEIMENAYFPKGKIYNEYAKFFKEGVL